MRANIICMKWGDKFSADYVNKLYAMVARNLSLPFQLTCLTDNPAGIRPEVSILPLPKMRLPENAPERGWRKLSVFKKKLNGLAGVFLFLDLDVVVVDKIDDFFTCGGDFLMAYDKKNAKKKIGNSSVFRFEIGKYPHIVENFERNFANIRRQFRHEQAYLSNEMMKAGTLEFFPQKWTPSYKYHCAPGWVKNCFVAPRIPPGAKIILFHGKPNPPEAILGKSGKWYRYLKPAPWVGDYWRE